MEESISATSRTCSTAFYCSNSYQLGTAAAPDDSENVDSGWTAYFLLASDDQEPLAVQKLQDGDVCGSASTLSSANNKTKDKLKLKKEEVQEDPLEDTASSASLLPNGAQDVRSNIPGCEQRPASSGSAKDKCWARLTYLEDWNTSGRWAPTCRRRSTTAPC